MGTKLSALIQNLCAIVGAGARQEFVLFGSAAIVLHGVERGREVGDLDVFVAPATFDDLGKRFALLQRTGANGVAFRFYNPAADIEILDDFPGVDFDEVRARAVRLAGSEGFPVGDLGDVIKWKQVLGREKDLKDIAAISAQGQDK